MASSSKEDETLERGQRGACCGRHMQYQYMHLSYEIVSCPWMFAGSTSGTSGGSSCLLEMTSSSHRPVSIASYARIATV